jgi:methylated-DNA-protein-cysteine methyltransferase-like protein
MRATKNNPDFFNQVYQVVRLIPFGRVTSYGAIAKYLGTAKSARMVGWAMNASHSQLEPIPAHRVVNRIGLLTGKANFSHPNEMAERLIKEGIEIKNDQIQSFNTHFWDPMTELDF